jgi:hypothetical protein
MLDRSKALPYYPPISQPNRWADSMDVKDFDRIIKQAALASLRGSDGDKAMRAMSFVAGLAGAIGYHDEQLGDVIYEVLGIVDGQANQ